MGRYYTRKVSESFSRKKYRGNRYTGLMGNNVTISSNTTGIISRLKARVKTIKCPPLLINVKPVKRLYIKSSMMIVMMVNTLLSLPIFPDPNIYRPCFAELCP
eukprot:sb/3478235/